MTDKPTASDYKQLQNRLHEIEEELSFYHGLMNYVPGHIYWLDKNNKYLGCNQEHAKNIGLKTRLDIIGKTNYDMPWKKVAEKVNETNTRVMESGKPITIKESGIVNGIQSTFLSHKVPLKNNNKDIIGLLGISIDITEIEELQKSLFEAKKTAEAASIAKTEFIANMSHDIRTPLTGVIGMSEILESSLEDAQQKEQAHMIHEGGEELLSMLNGILDDIKAAFFKLVVTFFCKFMPRKVV